jgi:hypothetical protein
VNIAVLLLAGVSLAVAACGSGSTVPSTVTRTFVLTEPGNTTLEAVITTSHANADLIKSDLAATEPAGAAFSTLNGDAHTLPSVCASSFQTSHGPVHIAVFASVAFPPTICQQLVKLGTSTPSAT